MDKDIAELVKKVFSARWIASIVVIVLFFVLSLKSGIKLSAQFVENTITTVLIARIFAQVNKDQQKG